MRDKREQMTSAGAGKLVFDLELLRLYAEGRKAAFWPQTILCLAVAAMAMVWAPPVFVALWLIQALSAVGVAGGAAGRFLHLIARAPVSQPSHKLDGAFAPRQDRKAICVKSWRRRFVLAETVNGLTWASFALLMTGVADPFVNPWAATFVVVAFMLAAATHTVVTAFIPAAAAAAMIPIALSMLLFMRPASLAGPDLPSDPARLRRLALFRGAGAAHLRQPA